MAMDNDVVTRAERAQAQTRARFVIDSRRSRFTVQAFSTGLLSAVGHNPTIGIRSFSGEVDFDPEGPSAGSLSVEIQAASLEVLDDVSDRDRREIEKVTKNDVLEVAQFPEIAFEAHDIALKRLNESLYTAAIIGQLSFHGVTRRQTLGARIVDSGDMLRVSGDFTLKQSDFQIKPVSVAGGALKLKDELKFAFEMIARRQEPAP